MKKVFVLGAGASREYGLPTGFELKQEISSLLSFDRDGNNLVIGDGRLLEAFKIYHLPVGIWPGLFMSAASKIRDGLPVSPSIDTFLETHADDEHVVMCGKLAIVQSILRYERKSSLYLKPDELNMKMAAFEQTWYTPFFNRVTAGTTISTISDRLSELGFVIFNYDRCFEHYFFHAFMKRYAVGIDDAAQLVNSMSIIHPYGSVGTLPFQDESETMAFFGHELSPEALINRAKRIRTYTEVSPQKGTGDGAPFAKFSELELLAFIGFAYHDQNVKLLFSDAILGEATEHRSGSSSALDQPTARHPTAKK